MSLSVATHCSFPSFLSHESPPPLPFCTSFLFSFLLSSPSHLSLLSSSLPIFSFPFSFLLLQEITLHLICLFSLTSLPLPLPSFSSPSHYFFSLYYSSLSHSLFLFPAYLLITNTFFFINQCSFLPSPLTIIHNIIPSLIATFPPGSSLLHSFHSSFVDSLDNQHALRHLATQSLLCSFFSCWE
ncbi:hypothetical protein K457DRAFT_1349380 [Linnemannia elongata AG-77]|uniref:Uncharacterized protein n=1 Tax=Linnemannia elongata AG-77 TaxID=1314771 RepID=A0A197KH53_9FUNG|nr:hypothetical protein K457DRAFT_1349380 [Linnemannia elongata AG-77]